MENVGNEFGTLTPFFQGCIVGIAIDWVVGCFVIEGDWNRLIFLELDLLEFVLVDLEEFSFELLLGLLDFGEVLFLIRPDVFLVLLDLSLYFLLVFHHYRLYVFLYLLVS